MPTTMDHVKLRNYIAQVVHSKQGCKATELPVYYVELFSGCSEAMALFGELDFISVVDDMAEEGDLVEVEYVLSSSPHRCKSFLLPRGTMLSGHCRPNCQDCP